MQIITQTHVQVWEDSYDTELCLWIRTCRSTRRCPPPPPARRLPRPVEQMELCPEVGVSYCTFKFKIRK